MLKFVFCVPNVNNIFVEAKMVFSVLSIFIYSFIPPSDENLFTTNHRHYATSPSTSSTTSSSRHHTRNSSSGSNNDTIQLLTMTSGRRVQNSLQRLEKQQDEFFEL